MKKTVSMLLAIIVAAIAICTLATSAFAIEITNPDDSRLETTTAAPTTAEPTTAAPTTAEATTAEPTTAESTTIQDEVVTRAEGETVIDEGETTTKAPATTKKPASVNTVIPSTGSSIAVPAIALLALAAGTVAVVKTKKDN